MRLRNETITLGLKRKPLNPILYERIDSDNVRIGSNWFKLNREMRGLFPRSMPLWNLDIALPPLIKTAGVTIYYGTGVKRFISNSWYSDINTDEL